jgi:xylulokinase
VQAVPPQISALRFIGGGANSALWCQTLADILDREIHQIAEPVLANAHGAALLAAVALGELTWDQIPDAVTVAAVYRPDPANRAVYDEAYEAYREAYRRVRPFYARRARSNRPGGVDGPIQPAGEDSLTR